MASNYIPPGEQEVSVASKITNRNNRVLVEILSRDITTGVSLAEQKVS